MDIIYMYIVNMYTLTDLLSKISYPQDDKHDYSYQPHNSEHSKYYVVFTMAWWE